MANTKCPKCGCVYSLLEEYEVDTWNVGHYGCTMENAPKIFKGYKDPGCPHCLKYEEELPFGEHWTIPNPVNISIGDLKTTRTLQNGRLVITQEQKMEFNINFNLVEEYLPITDSQWNAIDKIQWNTKHKFTGNSREDAFEFIQAHMAESMQKARKRRNTFTSTRQTGYWVTDEDCDAFGLDASMFT